MTDVLVTPTERLEGELQALSSKNYTTRYLLAAALAEGTSTIYYPAHSEDSDAMRRCIKDLGAVVEEDEEKIVITGFGKQPRSVQTLDVGNAGAVLRFLLAVTSLSTDIFFLNQYPDSLGKRPHDDLITALEAMGVGIEHNDGKLPIRVRGGQAKGGKIQVSGNVSSQFLSALLFLTPMLEEDSEIEVLHDLKSKIVVGQTLEVLEQAGIVIEAAEDYMYFRVPGRQVYKAQTYSVQGDYPGSAAVLAAAAVTQSDITIHRLEETSKQGERAIVDVLRMMNVPLTHEGGTLRLQGNGKLKAVEFDGDQATDAVLAMVAAAVFAEGTSRFYNVENLRYKECDRITDYLNELRKAGANVEERQSEIIVHGRPEGVEGGVEIDAHYDHRVIMALTVVGLRAQKPIRIRDAHHVAKSYPIYFDHLRALGANVEWIGFENPDRKEIANILSESKKIAVVGLSDNPDRTSYMVSAAMQQQGYEIIPVNPKASSVLGSKSYASLADIPDKIDIVNVFRRSEFTPAIAKEAVAIGAKTLWLQQGVFSEEAANVAKEGGLKVIMDRCIKVEEALRKSQF